MSRKVQKLTVSTNSTNIIHSFYRIPPHNVSDTPFGLATNIYSNKVLKPTKPSEIGSESYRVSLSRAFNLAKQKIYFNPDMTKFITLTYADNMVDPKQLQKDIKNLLKTETRLKKNNKKYLYVIEKQQRGALHVHMIANDFFQTNKNKNGYLEITNWKHGFSSILDVKAADSNFKPYLYLFKYMRKSQKIGSRFVHSSKNLNHFEPLTDYNFDKHIHKLHHSEYSINPGDGSTSKKLYYKKEGQYEQL